MVWAPIRLGGQIRFGGPVSTFVPPKKFFSEALVAYNRADRCPKLLKCQKKKKNYIVQARASIISWHSAYLPIIFVITGDGILMKTMVLQPVYWYQVHCSHRTDTVRF